MLGYFDGTAFGFHALLSNTTGYRNVANGAYALYSDTIGTNNVATGTVALYSNTTGHRNTATEMENGVASQYLTFSLSLESATRVKTQVAAASILRCRTQGGFCGSDRWRAHAWNLSHC